LHKVQAHKRQNIQTHKRQKVRKLTNDKIYELTNGKKLTNNVAERERERERGVLPISCKTAGNKTKQHVKVITDFSRYFVIFCYDIFWQNLSIKQESK